MFLRRSNRMRISGGPGWLRTKEVRTHRCGLRRRGLQPRLRVRAACSRTYLTGYVTQADWLANVEAKKCSPLLAE